MSGFDKNWLTLREPADLAARDRALRDQAVEFVSQGEQSILDIGCGTGSTWRALASHMPENTRWLLLDNDTALLAEATKRIGGAGATLFIRHDLNDLDLLPMDGVTLITASALFDLCSENFVEAFAATLRDAQTGLYAALNYNGVIEWSHSHPLDAAVVAAFNRHQTTDKGLGPALGPASAARLEHWFSLCGFAVSLADSPWRMGTRQDELQHAFLSGLRQPVLETGMVGESDFDTWMEFRSAAVAEAGSLCVVGHTDVLALPSPEGR